MAMLAGKLVLDSARRLPAPSDAGTTPAKRHRPSYQVRLSEDVLSMLLSNQSDAGSDSDAVELDLGSDPVGPYGSKCTLLGCLFPLCLSISCFLFLWKDGGTDS
jgi:hypothetical protein